MLHRTVGSGRTDCHRADAMQREQPPAVLERGRIAVDVIEPTLTVPCLCSVGGSAI